MTVSPALFSASKGTWRTPRPLFDLLDDEFDFTLDPCADPDALLCPNNWTQADDGMQRSWRNQRVFINPPYSDGKKVGGRLVDDPENRQYTINSWVRTCANQALCVGALVVALLPARTDTEWWWNYVPDAAEVRLLKGRLRFSTPDGKTGSAPFPSAIVVWRPHYIGYPQLTWWDWHRDSLRPKSKVA